MAAIRILGAHARGRESSIVVYEAQMSA